MTSSSSEDEYEHSKKNRNTSRTHHHYHHGTNQRKSSRDLLVSEHFRSSTTPRNHGSSHHKHNKNSPKNRYKSSENILEKTSANASSVAKQTFSEGELLEDKSIFDFTSNRAKKSGPFDHLLNKTGTTPKAEPPEEDHSKKSNNDSNSDKSHEPFGSTEFPTLKRNLKLTTSTTTPNVENEYESMTSIRNSVWTPTDNVGGKTVDGLSSPSVIAQDQNPKGEDQTQAPIEPPPNFSSSPKDIPPPLPVKKYAIKPNKHETQFHATLQRSAKNQQSSPKVETPKKGTENQVEPKSNGNSKGSAIIQASQVRMASMQAAQEIKQRQQRSKRIRNRSLEMVLDENRSSDSSPSRKRYNKQKNEGSKLLWSYFHVEV